MTALSVDKVDSPLGARRTLAGLLAYFRLQDPRFNERVRLVYLARGLLRARAEQGITQVEMGRRMGVAQSVVARLESGGSNAKFLTLYRYTQAVGVSLDRIMSWVAEEEMKSDEIERLTEEAEALG